MTTPREFTMNFNFKLVYTDIVYNVETSSNTTLHDLFDDACNKFAPHIDYYKYYIDYVVAGQEGCELAPEIDYSYLYESIWNKFGEKWRQISFYIRPMNRETETFIRMDRYIEEPTRTIQELGNRVTDVLGVNLPPPPEQTR